MIYNLSGQIQEDNLQHLALFAEYGRVAQGADDKDTEDKQSASGEPAAETPAAQPPAEVRDPPGPPIWALRFEEIRAEEIRAGIRGEDSRREGVRQTDRTLLLAPHS